MEGKIEGGSCTRPPLLDSSNYTYWKNLTKAFITNLDAWKIIVTGWSPPTMKDENREAMRKPEILWDANEDKLASQNSKALDAIFNAVTPQEYKRISNCVSAQEAWKILEVTHKGTGDVKKKKDSNAQLHV